MYALIFLAVGTWTNGTTGQQVHETVQVPSVTVCAQLINANLTPIEVHGGAEEGTWYLTSGECKVVEVQK